MTKLYALALALATLTASCGSGGSVSTQTVSCDTAEHGLVSASYPGSTAEDIAEHVTAFVIGTDLAGVKGAKAETVPVLAFDGLAKTGCEANGIQGGTDVTFTWSD